MVLPCNKGPKCPYCHSIFDVTRYIDKKGPKRPTVMIFPKEVINLPNQKPFIIAHKTTPKTTTNGITKVKKTSSVIEKVKSAIPGYSVKDKLTPVSVITLGGMPFQGGSCTAYWNHETDTILIIDYGRKVWYNTQDLDGYENKRRSEIGPSELPYEDFLVRYRDKVEAILITHLHLDHCGSLPYLPEEIKDIPVYMTSLADLTVKHMCAMGEVPAPEDIRIFKPGDRLSGLKGFKVSSFPLIHSTPETVMFDIKIGNQRVLHFGDFNLAGENESQRKAQDNLFNELILKGPIDCLTFDAVGASRKGKRLYEEKVFADFERIVNEATGRIVIPIFASNITRIQHLIEIAEKHGRRATAWGNAMEVFWHNAKQLGYLKTSITTNDMSIKELLDSSKEIAFVTGGQAEPGAQLTKSAFSEERTQLRLRHDDTIVFCQDPIPGNEDRVRGLIERLKEDEYNVIENGQNGLVTHISGHCLQGDLDEFLTHFKSHTRLFYPQHMSRRNWEVVEERYSRKYNLLLPKFKQRTPLWEV